MLLLARFASGAMNLAFLSAQWHSFNRKRCLISNPVARALTGKAGGVNLHPFRLKRALDPGPSQFRSHKKWPGYTILPMLLN